MTGAVNVATPMTDAFILGAIFGICITLVVLIIGIALYVRFRGGFTIAPPTQPIHLPDWLRKRDDA